MLNYKNICGSKLELEVNVDFYCMCSLIKLFFLYVCMYVCKTAFSYSGTASLILGSVISL